MIPSSRLDWRGIHVSPALHSCPSRRRRSRSAWLRGVLLAFGRLAFTALVVLVQAAICMAFVLALVFAAITLLGGR